MSPWINLSLPSGLTSLGVQYLCTLLSSGSLKGLNRIGLLAGSSKTPSPSSTVLA